MWVQILQGMFTEYKSKKAGKQMYKILIKYSTDHNLWKQYGTTTSSTASDTITFQEFQTDDVEILKAEIIKLDQQYGFENIKVYKDVTANYSVEITEEE